MKGRLVKQNQHPNNGRNLQIADGRVRRVLVFAYDSRSIKERKQILADNGYEVQVSSELASALTLVGREKTKFDFLVIGYAVPEQERMRLAQVYRNAHPRGQMIFLYKNGIRNTNPAVAALLSINGAQDNLLTAIRDGSLQPTPPQVKHRKHDAQKGTRTNA